jgi:hypothetical protein
MFLKRGCRLIRTAMVKKAARNNTLGSHGGMLDVMALILRHLARGPRRGRLLNREFD